MKSKVTFRMLVLIYLLFIDFPIEENIKNQLKSLFQNIHIKSFGLRKKDYEEEKNNLVSNGVTLGLHNKEKYHSINFKIYFLRQKRLQNQEFHCQEIEKQELFNVS